jgi:hypothetical protein
MNFLNLNTVKVEGKTREDLLIALASLAGCDADFCGENGEEYLWDEAMDYESNLEYCLDLFKDIETDKELISKFIDRWISSDYYYQDYHLDVFYDADGKAEFIALATMN